MQVFLDVDAQRDLKKMDQAQLLLFQKHIDKLADSPPGKHLRHNMPYFVEKVDQGRIVYQVNGDIAYIVRCFTTHKEYEKWYKS